jgi:hypothetical protein
MDTRHFNYISPTDRVYTFVGSLYCESCAVKIIRGKLRTDREIPGIDCRACGFKGRVGRKAARKAFDLRSHAEWLQCPKCGDTSATFDCEDSDGWPQSLPEIGEADSVEHCDSGARCPEAIELTDGSKIGAWMGNSLTSDGVRELTREILEARERGEFNEVLEMWAHLYSDSLDLRVWRWRVSFATFCGMSWDVFTSDWDDDHREGFSEAREAAIDVLRARVETKHTVTRIKRDPRRGRFPVEIRWECHEPADSLMVPDTAGILVLERERKGER